MEVQSQSTKLPGLEERQTMDLEAEDSNQDPGDKLYRSEQTEITPVEALKWNVDGDESPCMLLIKSNAVTVDSKKASSVNIFDTVPEVAACVSNKDDPTIACNSEYLQ